MSSASSEVKDLSRASAVFRERVGRLHHRGDDVLDADLLGLEEVADRLAAADLHGEPQLSLVRDLHEPQQLVHAGALGLELRLDAEA